jgi:hypothetical protein
MADFTLDRLGFPWPTRDPFLFCVHHLDAYPAGDERQGPRDSLAGRRIGMDFTLKDGWRMYHGERVPGFPAHPHRGFETVTVARQGYIDHADSLGAAARYGHGDVQWMTAGRGIVHSEMFPLVHPDADNPTELFQIWLNLPARHKMVEPHFSMLWNQSIPVHRVSASGAGSTEVVTVAGAYQGKLPPAPPPHSWASEAEADVAIWTLRMEPGAVFELPAGRRPETLRTLYFFHGNRLKVDHRWVEHHAAIHLAKSESTRLENGSAPAEVLMLQGRPLREPVAHHGPFVMNTQEELAQAMVDYRQTRFGGWPWDDAEPVHPREGGRFARFVDGHTEVGPT